MGNDVIIDEFTKFKRPELVEIGIATDAVFGVIIMIVLGNQIYKTLHTLDTGKLNTLKG